MPKKNGGGPRSTRNNGKDEKFSLTNSALRLGKKGLVGGGIAFGANKTGYLPFELDDKEAFWIGVIGGVGAGALDEYDMRQEEDEE